MFAHCPTEAVLLSATTRCLVFSRPVGRQDILNYVELDKDALANMVCSSGSHKFVVDDHWQFQEEVDQVVVLSTGEAIKKGHRYANHASALKPLSGLITHLDLRRTGMDIGQIQWMSASEHVDFGQNPIEKVPSDLQLPYLTFLSLANTKVRSIDDVKPVSQFKKLERLLVCETELAESHTKELYDFVGSLRGEGETAI
uniref:Leucine-rich repeat domain-containing protein n=1 Tax=Steinernema glaseri TaxID=37863 RepID=A0A1I7Z1L1_9BILA